MTDGLKDKHRQTIIDILAAHERVEKVVLFGSRAMGTFTPTSDVDIALFGDKLTLSDQANLAAAIAELPMAQQVDLLLYKSIRNEKLIEHIKKHGVAWYRRPAAMGSGFLITEYGLMSADLSRAQLKELCVEKRGIQTGPFGSQLHQRDYVRYGTPIITVEHLGEDRILHQDTPCVKKSDKKRLSRYILRKGDIVFSRVGSVDRRALVRIEEDGWLFSGRCLRIRPEANIIDAGFLSYFFGHPGFKEYIRRIAVGATMPSLNTKILSEIPIYYPPLPEQRAIAHILGTLDDKIELNRRMNATLEAMARAIFKSWFVDFDPVWENMKRKGIPEAADHPGAPSLPEHMLALFPDGFEATELGEIPRGWRVQTIGRVIELAYGKALKASDRVPGNVSVYGSNGQVGWHNEALVVGPGIVIGRKGNPGIVTWSPRDFYPIDTTFYVKPIGGIKSLYYLYCSLRNQNLPRLSSDSAVPGLNRNMAYMSDMLVPPGQVLAAFDEQATPLFEQMDANDEESRTLAGLRDTLLPRLISGELRVTDVEPFTQKEKIS